MDAPDRILCRTGLVTIGQFRAGIDHPLFHDSGPIERSIFVFPRTSVLIRHQGEEPFLADPCTVTFYNAGQRYSREISDARGDLCEWFAVRPDVLADVLADVDATVLDRPDRPFSHTHGPSDAESYGWQRTIIRYVRDAADPDSLAVDEAVIRVLVRLVGLAYDRPVESAGGCPSRWSGATRDLTEDVRSFILDHFRTSVSLEDIAGAVGRSVFHLCRVFRRETGMTIQTYRQQLRLRRALELVAEPRSNLTAIGLQLGFSSHSHFTAAFRRAFAMTPSQFRRRPSARRIRELEAKLS